MGVLHLESGQWHPIRSMGPEHSRLYMTMRPDSQLQWIERLPADYILNRVTAWGEEVQGEWQLSR
jgi:hypothetical protein